MNQVENTPFLSESDFDAAVVKAMTAAAAYYDTDAQLISDAEYDTLIERIEASIAIHPTWNAGGLLDEVAAGQSVGGDVVHPIPMLSLAKAKNESEVQSFMARLNGPAVVEVKLDGMAVRAVYVDGILDLVATRGDGSTGEDVTSQAARISGLPTKLDVKIDLEVRGEVYMTDSDFDEANVNRVASGKPAFVNPRNATAGSLRATDAKYFAPMSFAAYDAMGDSLGQFDNHISRMEQVSSFGISTAISLMSGNYEGDSGEQVLSLIEKIGTARTTLGFPIDGAVVKASKDSKREELGSVSRTPKWAVAFKYAADVSTTILRDVEVAVGRTGRISLRAALDPVFVAGTTISFATLHNPKFVEDADFRIGDTVFVYRAGDVIPRVSAVDLTRRQSDSVKWVAPQGCPTCSQPWDKSSLLWRCRTPECSTVGRIEYATSRDVLDIEGFSTALAEQLVESGLVNDVADLYSLTVDQIASQPVGDGSRSVGQTVAKKIVKEITDSKSQPLARVITALGIRMTGRTMGRRLAAHFVSMSAFQAATESQLAEVEGVGSEKARVIREGLAGVRDIVARLAAAGVTMESDQPEPVNSSSLPLSGKTVVVSGAVPGLTRNEANEWVERLGGKSSGSVSAKTSILVSGDGSGSKTSKAEELGVTIMSAEAFADLVNSNR
jgi:DNA ligase (NAD+)